MKLQKYKEYARYFGVTIDDSEDYLYSVLYLDKLSDENFKLREFITISTENDGKIEQEKKKFYGKAIDKNKISRIICEELHSIAKKICNHKVDDLPILTKEMIKEHINKFKSLNDLFTKDTYVIDDNKPSGMEENNAANTIKAIRLGFYEEVKFLVDVFVHLPTATCNFIKEICTNVYNDRKDLEKFYLGDGKEIVRLRDIEIAGGETHRKCKKPVFLTFEIHDKSDIKNIKNKKLVYKPRDVEIDCLITGDFSAFKELEGYDSFKESLFEILNKAIEKNKQTYSHLIPLPTYKILPRKYCSKEKIKDSGQLLDTDQLYGYAEFLYSDYDKDIPISGVNVDLKHRVFRKDANPQDVKAKCSQFYRIFGQYFAMAQLYSMRDLHQENVIAHEFKPYLVDLEASCLKPVINNELDDTGLEDALTKTKSKSGAKISNFLQHVDGSREGINSLIFRKKIFGNFVQMLDLYINQCMQTDSIIAFNKRIQQCLVRNVVYGTGFIQTALNNIYYFYIPAYTEDDRRGNKIKEDCADWLNDKSKDPGFIVLQKELLDKSFKYKDYAIWGHILNTTKLIDCDGHEIKIPTSMNYLGDEHTIEQRDSGSGDYYLKVPMKENMIAFTTERVTERKNEMQSAMHGVLHMDYGQVEQPRFTVQAKQMKKSISVKGGHPGRKCDLC